MTTAKATVSKHILLKKGKRKVQGVPQSQTAALPKQAQTEQTYQGTKRTRGEKKIMIKQATHDITDARTKKKYNEGTASEWSVEELLGVRGLCVCVWGGGGGAEGGSGVGVVNLFLVV